MPQERELTLEELVELVINEIVSHDFPYGFGLVIPGTKNDAYFYVVKDLLAPGNFRIQLHARREGSSLTTWHMRESGTEAEIRGILRGYVADKETMSKICAEILELSRSVDDKEGEFPSDY